MHMIDDFSMDEMENAIADLSSHKSADQLGIVAEMTKFGSKLFHEHLLKYF